MNRLSLAVLIALMLVGCVGRKMADKSPALNDGYVPWWVEDGVPNSEGVIVR